MLTADARRNVHIAGINNIYLRETVHYERYDNPKKSKFRYKNFQDSCKVYDRINTQFNVNDLTRLLKYNTRGVSFKFVFVAQDARNFFPDDFIIALDKCYRRLQANHSIRRPLSLRVIRSLTNIMYYSYGTL